jgi:hypothetical protein
MDQFQETGPLPKYLRPAKVEDLLATANELGRVLNGLIASIKIRAA